MIQLPTRDKTYYHSLLIDSLPAAGAPPAVFSKNIEEESYVLLTSLLGVDDAQNPNLPKSAYGLKVAEQAGAEWFSDFICSDLIFGLGANPRRLPTPIIMAPNSVIDFYVKPTGLAAAYNRFTMALEGVKKPTMTKEQYTQLRQRPYYVYVTPFGVDFRAGETRLELDFIVDSDADFVVQNLCGVGVFNNSGGLVQQWDAVNVQIITDPDDTNRKLFKSPIGWYQVFGQPDVAGGPQKLLSPLVFPRKTKVRVELTVDAAIGTLTHDWKCIQAGFEGYKIKR